MPPHLKKSINQAQLENNTYEQIVSYLEKELELNGLEAPDELQKNTVTQQATQQNPGKPKPTCHHCKKPGHYRNRCRYLKREKNETRNNPNSADNNNNISGQTNCNAKSKIPNNTNANNTNNQKTEDPDFSTNPVRPVVKLTIPQRIVTLEQTQRRDRLPGIDDWKDKTKFDREMLKTTQMPMFQQHPIL